MSTEIGYYSWYIPVQQLLDSLRTGLEARGREKLTMERYDLVFRQYLGMVTRHKIFSDERLDEFLAAKRNQGMSSNSLRWLHNVFHTIYRVFNKPFPYTKDDLPPSEEKHRPMFTEEQALLLTKAAYKSASSHTLGIRNRAIVRLGAAIGLRRVELQLMDIQDVHFSSPENTIAYVEVQTQKHGRKVRREIDSVTEQHLREWIGVRTKRRRALGSRQYWGGTDEDPYPLFTAGKNGSRLGIGTISRVLGLARREAGIRIPRAGFHALRRMRVTGYHNGGASEAQITQEMGWRNPNTVKGYIMPDEDTTKLTIREASPYFQDSNRVAPRDRVETAVEEVEDDIRQERTRQARQTWNRSQWNPEPAEPPAPPLKRLPTVAELRARRAQAVAATNAPLQVLGNHKTLPTDTVSPDINAFVTPEVPQQVRVGAEQPTLAPSSDLEADKKQLGNRETLSTDSETPTEAPLLAETSEAAPKAAQQEQEPTLPVKKQLGNRETLSIDSETLLGAEPPQSGAEPEPHLSGVPVGAETLGNYKTSDSGFTDSAHDLAQGTLNWVLNQLRKTPAEKK